MPWETKSLSKYNVQKNEILRMKISYYTGVALDSFHCMCVLINLYIFTVDISEMKGYNSDIQET